MISRLLLHTVSLSWFICVVLQATPTSFMQVHVHWLWTGVGILIERPSFNSQRYIYMLSSQNASSSLASVVNNYFYASVTTVQ